ncbi:MAG: hypothetical protein M3141_04225 [Actinomycetota bacterium]|nr:hypothetical protein [Actinomycetota bacterium]
MEPGTPEEAAAEARRRAREREYPVDPTRLEALGADERGGLSRLQEWAAIEVSPDVVRSTRRTGAPITRFKRFLARMLLQYHNEEHAQITRFNVHLLGYVAALEERVAELERRLERRE